MAGENHGETGPGSGGSEGCDFRRNFGANICGEFGSIKDSGWHFVFGFRLRVPGFGLPA
jgi:hypothetical protein